MRVFISWSGEVSRAAARALTEWLPYIVPAAKPWMSDHDIQAGALWEQELANGLATSDFGLLVLTPQNRDAPWLLFEAGVLAARTTVDRIVPYLVGLPLSGVPAPLTRFQTVDADDVGTRKLLDVVNSKLPPRDRVRIDRLAILFDALWPKLASDLAAIPGSTPPRRPAEEYLDEILALLRSSTASPSSAVLAQTSIEQVLGGLTHEISALRGKIESMQAYESRGGGAAEQPWWDAYVERHRQALSLYLQALASIERAGSLP